jgi:hypothetical protein
MRTILLILLFIGVIDCVRAQDTPSYSAMILAFDGEGIITRNLEEFPIVFPQCYYPGDELSVKKGLATVMLFSGEEVPLSAVSYYKIPDNDVSSSSEIFEMVNNDVEDPSLLSQSGVAYRIRGKSNVFPSKTKVFHQENAVLRIAFENLDELAMSFKVIDSQTQKVIFEQACVNDSIISLAEVPFEVGRSYYWTFNNTPTGKPEMGTIVVPKQEETTGLTQLENLNSHFKNLNAISKYYNERYFFDAYALISRCIEEYPNFRIYQEMLENILVE